MRERHVVLWQRLDLSGHELCELMVTDEARQLAGVALVTHGERPCRLDYSIDCDRAWVTHRAHVRGRIGLSDIEIVVEHDDAGAWRVNGVAQPSLDGCVDIDLGFSPATNLLPLRRLALAVGDRAPVRAAWVKFPTLELEVLEQTYTRTSATTYRYESAGGAFTREIVVNDDGFVLEYPGMWRAGGYLKGL